LALSKESSSSKSLTLIAIVLTIAALYLGRRVFIPLALAVIFSFLLAPAVTLLENIRFGRVPAVIVVLLVSLALAGAFSYGVAVQLVEIMVEFPDYKANLDVKIQSLHPAKNGNLSKATATMQELNKELAEVPEAINSNNTQEKQKGTGGPVRSIVPVQIASPPTNLFQDLRELLGPLAGPIETAAIVIIFALFMMVKREDLRNRAIRLAGRGRLSVVTQALDDAGKRLSRYLLLQFLVNGGYGLIYGVALYFIGVPHALLFGVLAGLLRFVPYIGALIAAALPTLMALAVYPGWHHAGLTFGAFLVLELLISNIIEPLLYGAHTGISSLAILVAAVFWATLWGPVGLILSTPLTVCLMVLGRYAPQLNFLEILLGDEPVLPPEQQFYQRLLAVDPEEARRIAEEHIKENPVASLYDAVLIPALKLAEQDRNIHNIDDDTKGLMLQGIQEMVEEMGDRLVRGDSVEAENAAEDQEENVKDSDSDLEPSLVKIACLAARNGPDELIATMLAQLLRHEGYTVREFKPGPIDTLLAELEREDCSVVCLSAMPPFSTSQARSVCKALTAKHATLQMVVGLWNLDGGSQRARERMGASCAALATTTLSDALAQVRALTKQEGPDSAKDDTEPPAMKQRAMLEA
jgi:predicted PurR-regulated permease PerM